MFTPGSDSLILDHYLEQLRKKPGALWDCKATKGILSNKALEAIWDRLLERNELRDAQKDFIEILYLKKKYKEEDWKAAINKAFECGAYDHKAIESIIQMLITPNQNNEKAVLERLGHIPIPNWECNLSEYATLTEIEASSAKRSDCYFDGDQNETIVKTDYTCASTHGYGMFGKWNGPILDQIIEDYLLEKKTIQGSFMQDSFDDTLNTLRCATGPKGGCEC